jgi:hypothetical protein
MRERLFFLACTLGQIVAYCLCLSFYKERAAFYSEMESVRFFNVPWDWEDSRGLSKIDALLQHGGEYGKCLGQALEEGEEVNASYRKRKNAYRKARINLSGAVKTLWQEIDAHWMLWQVKKVKEVFSSESLRSEEQMRRGALKVSPSSGIVFVWQPALGLWVGKYEVKVSEFRKYKPEHDNGFVGYSVARQRLNGDQIPVVNVRFDEARDFCEWLTKLDRLNEGADSRLVYRLPSSSEWLTFAQCGDARVYPWGNTYPPSSDSNNYKGEEARNYTHEVSSFWDLFREVCPVELSGANSWGLYGVGGNVAEWCCKDTDAAICDGSRGADWDTDIGEKEQLKCTYKGLAYGSQSRLVGFRIVLSPTKDTVTAVQGLPLQEKTEAGTQAPVVSTERGEESAEADRRQNWSYNVGSFELTGNGYWNETSPEIRKKTRSGSFVFKEVSRSREVVSLYDASRRLMIRLSDSRATWSTDEGKTWHLLTEGTWVTNQQRSGS